MCRLRNVLAVLLVATTVFVAVKPHDAAAIGGCKLRVDYLAVATAAGRATDSTNDGPHVYWMNDSTVVVFYFCDGRMLRPALQAVDTLRFNGMCDDSSDQYVMAAAEPETEPHVFEDVKQVFAVSDIHGEYEHLIDLLQNSGVVDDKLHWSWGDGHLVALGDVFDRGDRVTEVLWFLHRLEREAKLAGGRVHLVLGNHELMVMRGDDRYVNEKYVDGIVRRTGIEHEDLYGPDMELGRWLRSKHVVVKLNDALFVHGGLAPDLVTYGLSLNDMNETARRSLDLRSYELVTSDTARFLFGSAGPLWYRGYHRDMDAYPQATSEQVEMILDFYDAEAVVVGHTEIGQVGTLYEGRVVGIDVPVQDLGSLQGLLWRQGKWFRVTGTGRLESIK